MKRPCVFLVADGTMAQVLHRFLSRGYLEDRLGCRTFDFDFQQDVVVDVRNGNTDGGIHRRAHQLLRRYLPFYQNAIVILDKNFGGRLPAAVVREEILRNLLHNGWSAECVEVVVIDPELEVWLWQRGNPHLAREFRYNGSVSLEEFLEAEGLWSSATLKPAKPKEAAGVLLQRYRAGPRIVVYRRIVEHISVRGCQDPAFNLLADALRRWFPIDIIP
jgi:hypothetical protein